jgi:O-antigen ligase
VSRKLLEIGLAAAILIAVGGFGGTEPVPWGIVEVLIFLLGLLVVACPTKSPASHYTKLLWFPLMLGAWVAVQSFESRVGRIGLDTHATKTQGLALATSIVAFFVALAVARGRESRKRLALYLMGIGLFEAFYGLAEYLAGWRYIWNVPRRFYLGSATGTYVNHNHFAGLLEMILPLPLGLAFYHWQSSCRRHRRRTFRSLLENLGEPAILKCLVLLLAATVLLVAIVFSLSRMGMISVLVSLGAMAAVVWTGRHRSPLPAALILLLLAGGVITAAWVGVGPVVEHFEQLPQNEPLATGTEGRVALWKDSVKLIRAHPWTGVGLGCFEIAFTNVQSVRLTYVIDHAHNDYLEIAAELGLPCALLFFGGLFWIAVRTLQASLQARSSLTRSLALGSFAGTSALLMHSIADFNLYIPANSLVFAVVLGIGYAASLEARAEVARPEIASAARGSSGSQRVTVKLKSSSHTVPAI